MYHKVLINMEEWIDIIDAQKTFVPKSIVEIGSLNGNDAETLENKYKTNNVFILEAHPFFYEQIKTKYPNYKVLNIAGSNVDNEIMFNCVDSSGINGKIGISSIHDRVGAKYHKCKVIAKRMDTIIKENSIQEIDLLKIDVEGHSFELLDGFGNKLKIVKAIHIENEHIICWENQKIYADSEKILINNGFILVSIKAGWPQSDSVWIRHDVFNPKWWR